MISTINLNLNRAKAKKDDEFYTLLEDIEKELLHEDYISFFKNRVVYCNCDNPEYSAFFQFFQKYFKELGIRKVIFTFKGNNPYKTELSLKGMSTTFLEDGSFQSEECIEILKESDLVVTNPPFFP